MSDTKLLSLDDRLRRGSDEDIDQLERMIRERKLDPNLYLPYMHKRLIHLPTAFNRLGLVKKLLELGADPNSRDGDGETPLMYATCNGYVDMCKLLLESDADPHLENDQGETALFCTTSLEIIDILLKRGLDINHTNRDGETPLMCLLDDSEAGHENERRAVEYLRQLGVQ